MIKPLYPALLLFVVATTALAAQRNDTYRRIDRTASTLVVKSGITVPELARQLAEPARNDTEKARSIYAWITQNIRYEPDSVDAATMGKLRYPRQQADSVLLYRSGICVGFANLYTALCREAGLNAETVNGIIRLEGGEIPDTGHVWNAVLINGQWQLVDPTWGTLPPPLMLPVLAHFDDHYFFPSPGEFLLDHLPNDPMWQLQENPIHFREFVGQNAESERISASGDFAFADTIAVWQTFTAFRQLEASADRISRYQDGNLFAALRHGQEILVHGVNYSTAISSALTLAIFAPAADLDTSVVISKLDTLDRMLHLSLAMQAVALDSTEEADLYKNALYGDQIILVGLDRSLMECARNSQAYFSMMASDTPPPPEWEPRHGATMAAVDFLERLEQETLETERKALLNVAFITRCFLGVQEIFWCHMHSPDFNNQQQVRSMVERLLKTEANFDRLLEQMPHLQVDDDFNVDSMRSDIFLNSIGVQDLLAYCHFEAYRSGMADLVMQSLNLPPNRIEQQAGKIRSGHQYLEKAARLMDMAASPALEERIRPILQRQKAFAFLVEGLFYEELMNAMVATDTSGASFDQNIPQMKLLCNKALALYEKAEAALTTTANFQGKRQLKAGLERMRTFKEQLDGY